MKISSSDVQAISNTIHNILSCQMTPLAQGLSENDEIFTSGDPFLNKKLGGGIRTGMVWEIVGERYRHICNMFRVLVTILRTAGLERAN